jgi:hypothetical protein
LKRVSRQNKVIEAAFLLINADLMKMPLENLFELANKIQNFLGGVSEQLTNLARVANSESPEAEVAAIQDLLGRLLLYQTVIKNFFQNLMKRVHDDYENRDVWREAFDDLTTMPPLAEAGMKVSLTLDLIYEPPTLDDQTRYDFLMKRWPLGPESGYRIKVSSKGDSPEEKILYDILRSLDGLPLSAIRQCPHCSKWFLHLSKIDKRFCSTQCRTRSASKQSYDKKKEEEKKKAEQVEKEEKLTVYEDGKSDADPRTTKSNQKKVVGTSVPKMKIKRKKED